MTIADADREALRAGWSTFITELSSVGTLVLDDLDDVDNAQELAEALRAVARIAIMVLQHRMEFNDPDFPVFFRKFDDRFKMAGPDTYVNYVSAALRGNATYRIVGNHHGRDLQIGSFWRDDLEMAPDGEFEIIASATKAPGNWQPLDPALDEAPTVLADVFPGVTGGLDGRVYYVDPADTRPPASLFIERIDEDRPRQPQPLSPELLGSQLDDSARLLHGLSRWWIRRASNIRGEHQPNVVGAPSLRPPGLATWKKKTDNFQINYGVCCWELNPDEALIIETEIPACDYWSFQLHNAWWESPDNQHRQTSVSHAHSYLDPDGRLRLVLAHSDPGVPNWLDTGSSRRGFVFYRWVRPTTTMPTPIATKVALDSVRDHLPAGHPVVARDARDAQLSARRRWYADRFQR